MSYRIVCTEQDLPTSHHHIEGVGTGTDPSYATGRWTVAEVRAAILTGTVFYTVSPSTGKVAYVELMTCWCGRKTIRSAADAVTDNNLDNLRICKWS